MALPATLRTRIRKHYESDSTSTVVPPMDLREERDLWLKVVSGGISSSTLPDASWRKVLLTGKSFSLISGMSADSDQKSQILSEDQHSLNHSKDYLLLDLGRAMCTPLQNSENGFMVDGKVERYRPNRGESHM